MCRVLLVFSVLECIVNVPALHGMSLDVCKLERFVPVPHTAVWLLKWDSLSLSLPMTLCLSLSLLSRLYLSHSYLWSMPGACAVGAVVFVSVQLRLWTCYHVDCVLVRQARVFVCVHTRLATLWSPMQCCLWTEELCMTEAGVKAARAFSW